MTRARNLCGHMPADLDWRTHGPESAVDDGPIDRFNHRTLAIDDPDDGGSEPGAWADAIANTPGLALLVGDTSDRKD